MKILGTKCIETFLVQKIFIFLNLIFCDFHHFLSLKFL